MELKSPEKNECSLCGNYGAFIFLEKDLICGNCYVKFSNKSKEKEVKKNRKILEGLKKENKI